MTPFSFPLIDLLGENLTHPRFLVDDVDPGVCDGSTCRGDFVKWAEWGIGLVVCKGGPKEYDDNFAALWRTQPEWRAGRTREPLFLTLAVKNATQLLLAGLDRFLCDVEAHPDKVVLVRTALDIDAARASGRVALLMGANRSDWFGDSPGVLRQFARLGLRMITLSQGMRDLGYDAYNETRSGGRLTELGVRMIREMNACGILIDIAHNNDVCARDIIEQSSMPVVSTHSIPRALGGGLRDMPDDVMLALAARGGVLGVFPQVQRPPGEGPYASVPREHMATAIAHIRYAVDVMGIDHVGIGTHFNTALMPWLVDALLADHYSDAEVAAIAGGNALRVLRQVLPG